MPTKSINLTNLEQEQILVGTLPPSVIKKVETLRKPKTSKYGKAKGMRGQIWVANKIAELFGVEWRQDDDESLIAVRPSGQHGVDIILRGEIRKKVPFDIEVKWSESFNFNDTINQAKENTNNGRYLLIVHNRKSFETPVVVMEWDAFAAFLKEYNNIS